MNRVIKTSAPRSSDSPVSLCQAARAGGPTLTDGPARPRLAPTVHVVRRRRRAGRAGAAALGDQESVVRREKDGAGARRITLSTSGHTQPGKHESEQKRDGQHLCQEEL